MLTVNGPFLPSTVRDETRESNSSSSSPADSMSLENQAGFSLGVVSHVLSRVVSWSAPPPDGVLGAFLGIAKGDVAGLH